MAASSPYIVPVFATCFTPSGARECCQNANMKAGFSGRGAKKELAG